ncbi:MAG: hypothetical protein ABGZ17_17695 [Planctomycetaceae bacterium]
MPDLDMAVIRYLRLADVAQRKGQVSGRNRFLLLAAVDACHAGLLDVATLCRERVLQDEPRHLIGRFATIPDAIRSEDFQPFSRRLARFCSREQAEHLLEQQSADGLPVDEWESIRAFAAWLMEQPHWTPGGDDSPRVTEA